MIWGDVLLDISGRLLSTLTTVQAPALAELRDIIARWDASATAEDLGLTWRSNKRPPPECP